MKQVRLDKIPPAVTLGAISAGPLSMTQFNNFTRYLKDLGYDLFFSKSHLSPIRATIKMAIANRLNIKRTERGIYIDPMVFFGQIRYWFHTGNFSLKGVAPPRDIDWSEVIVMFRLDGTPAKQNMKSFLVDGVSFIWKGIEIAFTLQRMKFFPLSLCYSGEDSTTITNAIKSMIKASQDAGLQFSQFKIGLDGGAVFKIDKDCKGIFCVCLTTKARVTCDHKIPIFELVNILRSGCDDCGDGTMKTMMEEIEKCTENLKKEENEANLFKFLGLWKNQDFDWNKVNYNDVNQLKALIKYCLIICILHGELRIGMHILEFFFDKLKNNKLYFPKLRMVMATHKIPFKIHENKKKSKNGVVRYRINTLRGPQVQRLLENIRPICNAVIPPSEFSNDNISVSTIKSYLNLSPTETGVNIQTHFRQIFQKHKESGPSAEAIILAGIFEAARDYINVLRNGIPNYKRMTERESRKYIMDFRSKGMKLHSDFATYLLKVKWYEQIIFKMGFVLLYLHPYGLSCFSQNSIEDYNKHLKQLQCRTTFCGEEKYMENVPYQDQAYSGIPDDFPAFDKLDINSCSLFPNCTVVPFGNTFIQYIKDRILNPWVSSTINTSTRTEPKDIEGLVKDSFSQNDMETIMKKGSDLTFDVDEKTRVSNHDIASLLQILVETYKPILLLDVNGKENPGRETEEKRKHRKTYTAAKFKFAKII